MKGIGNIYTLEWYNTSKQLLIMVFSTYNKALNEGKRMKFTPDNSFNNNETFTTLKRENETGYICKRTLY